MPLPPRLSDTVILLRDFSRALPLQSLPTEILGEKYVNRTIDKIRDPVLNLRAAIRNELEEGSGCYLFSGLRGSGKTTELKRLIAELREKDGIHAYYCDASDYLDLNDPRFRPAEIVLTALAGLGDAIRREHGEGCLGQMESFLASTVGRVKTFCKEMALDKMAINIPGLGVELARAESSPS
jgi:hypothetical protein